MSNSDESLDIQRLALVEIEQLLDLEEAARRAALSALDAQNPVLARAVRRMLARDPDAPGWMPTEAPGLWEAEDQRLPERIGVFAVKEVIGRGGMGVVLRGERDDGLFEQTVAIKLMRSGIATFHIHERFMLERQILARLDSPSVSRILDGGVWEDRPYLIMEYVAGVPVTTYARVRHLDLKARLSLFVAVCAAVQYAHRQLIIHADLKPSNIMVTGDGRVKLLDFGIARLIDDGIDRPADAGNSASLAVTRAYAAPERRRGDRPTIAGDVYSLGAILYELLTDRIGDPSDPAIGDRSGMLWPTASGAVAGNCVSARQLAGDLDAILARALADDPAVRYPDVAAFLADITAWSTGYPVSARAAGRRLRIGKFVVRHRRGLAITAVLGVLLAGAAMISTVQAIRADRARAQAMARFDIARGAAHYLLFDLYDALARQKGTVAQRAQIADRSARYLDRLVRSGRAPADLRLESARGYRRLAAIEGLPGVPNLGRPDQAMRALDRADAILAALAVVRPRDVDVLTERGWVAADRWLLHADNVHSPTANARARRYFDAAIAVRPDASEALLGRLTTMKSTAYDLIWSADQPARALPVAAAALAQVEARDWAPALKPAAVMLTINLLNRIGDARYYTGDIAGSLTAYARADGIVDARIAAEGATPQWLILKGENAFNISGSLGEMPGSEGSALSVARAGEAALKTLLSFGPDAAAEKKLLVLYGQEAAVLDASGNAQAALGPSRASVALRTRRLAAAPHDPQRSRDLAIGLAPNATLLAKAGLTGPACAAASRAVQLWATIKADGRLGVLDANRNVPAAVALKAKLCRG